MPGVADRYRKVKDTGSVPGTGNTNVMKVTGFNVLVIIVFVGVYRT